MTRRGAFVTTRIKSFGNLTYIETSGSPDTVGYEVGRGAERQIASAVRMLCQRWGAGVAALERLAAPYRDALEEHLPRCAAELRGLARGAGVPYSLLVALNAGQEIAAHSPAGSPGDYGCSCVGLPGECTSSGGVILGHNEDASPGYEDTCYVVRARQDDGPGYLAFTYAGLLLHQGLNECGIGQVGNALYFDDISARGIPKLPVYRAALEARFLEEAIRTATHPRRANGQNHMLAERSGLLSDVEVSATRSALIWAKGSPLVHANHAQDPIMQELESGDRLNSRLRQARLEQLALAGHGTHTVDSVWAMLSDHANYPKSVCKHLHETANPAVRTIAGVVVDLGAGELHVAIGNPCEAQRHVFRL
jgi:isopenicillin-N N-acyltransferase-like protein